MRQPGHSLTPCRGRTSCRRGPAVSRAPQPESSAPSPRTRWKLYRCAPSFSCVNIWVTWLHSQTRLTVSSAYKGVGDAFISIVRKEGPRALFGGITPSLIGIIPYSGLNLGTYDALRYAYTKHTGRPVPKGASLAFGALAGATAASACFPLEVVRRRAMMGQACLSSAPEAGWSLTRSASPGIRQPGCGHDLHCTKGGRAGTVRGSRHKLGKGGTHERTVAVELRNHEGDAARVMV